MKEIESGLFKYYDPEKRSTDDSSSYESMEVTPPQTATTVPWIPFAKVTLVTEGSPADYAVS